MVLEERDSEENDRRRPRVRGQSKGTDDEDLVDDDDDIGDHSGDEDDSEEELQIPDDPAHEARMAVLLAENSHLEEEVQRQNQILADMNERTELILEHTARVREEVDRLKALGKQREKDAKNAASTNECKPQRDPNPHKREHGGDDEDQDHSGASSAQSMN